MTLSPIWDEGIDFVGGVVSLLGSVILRRVNTTTTATILTFTVGMIEIGIGNNYNTIVLIRELFRQNKKRKTT